MHHGQAQASSCQLLQPWAPAPCNIIAFMPWSQNVKIHTCIIHMEYLKTSTSKATSNTLHADKLLLQGSHVSISCAHSLGPTYLFILIGSWLAHVLTISWPAEAYSEKSNHTFMSSRTPRWPTGASRPSCCECASYFAIIRPLSCVESTGRCGGV
jgi:hypothetical protein